MRCMLSLDETTPGEIISHLCENETHLNKELGKWQSVMVFS